MATEIVGIDIFDADDVQARAYELDGKPQVVLATVKPIADLFDALAERGIFPSTVILHQVAMSALSNPQVWDGKGHRVYPPKPAFPVAMYYMNHNAGPDSPVAVRLRPDVSGILNPGECLVEWEENLAQVKAR